MLLGEWWCTHSGTSPDSRLSLPQRIAARSTSARNPVTPRVTRSASIVVSPFIISVTSVGCRLLLLLISEQRLLDLIQMDGVVVSPAVEPALCGELAVFRLHPHTLPVDGREQAHDAEARAALRLEVGQQLIARVAGDVAAG